jgi:hypothetical protein
MAFLHLLDVYTITKKNKREIQMLVSSTRTPKSKNSLEEESVPTGLPDEVLPNTIMKVPGTMTSRARRSRIEGMGRWRDFGINSNHLMMRHTNTYPATK